MTSKLLLFFISAKFDPPAITKFEAVPKKNGCLKLNWRLSQQQAWMRSCRLNLEVRLRTADSSEWSDQPVSTRHSRYKQLYSIMTCWKIVVISVWVCVRSW